ncbi:MAG: hypothetical protein H0U00_00590 [Actinobacteria bacterium]|nr:hypothetical protein [Actinomycetota bacterium]
MITKLLKAFALFAATCLAAGCGTDPEPNPPVGAPDPPVGTPVLPDLMPKPQLNVTTGQVNGKWRMFFSTIIVNVGKGDLFLRATRGDQGTWNVEQGIQYSGGGAKVVPVSSTLIWGGDGHHHWHVVRVATVRLVSLKNGRPKDDALGVDGKVGFCFYDHTHELERGPEEALYSARGCGKEQDTFLWAGLSPGWNDTYRQTLPGQSIDVTGLPDGKYRLWTEVDETGSFREATRKNNRTWIDLDLRMTPDGLSANTIGTGPTPS